METVSMLRNSESTLLTVRVGASLIKLLAWQRHSSQNYK